MININDIVTIAKKKIGTRVTITDASILDYAEEVEQTIKNYCNISVIPDELKYVWANIVTDYIVGMSPESLGAGTSSEQDVTGIGLSGISISFGSTDSAGKEIAKKSGALLVDFIKNYTKQLQNFRRVKW